MMLKAYKNIKKYKYNEAGNEDSGVQRGVV